jgi:hypothetical protein
MCGISPASGPAVGRGVEGATVGAAVGAWVGVAVAVLVGDAVAAPVGDAVAARVGVAVGAPEGAVVAEAVGAPGEAVAPLLGVATGLPPKPCGDIPVGPVLAGVIGAGGKPAPVLDPPEHADKRRGASIKARQ